MDGMEPKHPETMRWIKCDLDGYGPEWRLAVSRGGDWHFPTLDFDEDKEVFEEEKCDWKPVYGPKDIR